MDTEPVTEGENDQVEQNTSSKKKSEVWQYFEIVNRKEWLAKCKQCNKSLSYRSSTSNLKKHLLRKHGDMIEKGSDDETVGEITYFEEEDAGDHEAFDKRKILRNGAWEYFEVVDEKNKLATCTLCQEEFSYRTTSANLAKHLKRRHCIEFEKITDEEYKLEVDDDDDDDDGVDEDSDDKDDSDKRKSKTSAAWEFFTIKDHERRLATCKLCESQFSYLTTVSNLMKHVRKRHSIKAAIGDAHFDDDDVDEDTKQDLPRQDLRSQTRSSVWLYFKCIDSVAKMAVCLICKKQLSFLTSITNLKKHLHRKHPRVQLHSSSNGKKMLISSDGQLYEIEEPAKGERADADDDQDAEPLELNAIYLDDYVSSPTAERPRGRPRTPPKRKRPYPEDPAAETVSSDEEITFQKKYVRKKQDSIDQFGKYLASLLKQLPKELSNQLQADFVKQVMGAQLSCEAQAGALDELTGDIHLGTS